MWRVRLLGGFCVRGGGEEKAADTGAGGDNGSAKMWNRRGISASSRCDPIDPMISPRTAENPQAVATNEVIDLCKIGAHDPAKFFRPVYAEGGGREADPGEGSLLHPGHQGARVHPAGHLRRDGAFWLGVA
eukprot:SAG25_NODE_130_length_14421_cov_71.473886_10_plen_131_part_00